MCFRMTPYAKVHLNHFLHYRAEEINKLACVHG